MHFPYDCGTLPRFFDISMLVVLHRDFKEKSKWRNARTQTLRETRQRFKLPCRYLMIELYYLQRKARNNPCFAMINLHGPPKLQNVIGNAEHAENPLNFTFRTINDSKEKRRIYILIRQSNGYVSTRCIDMNPFRSGISTINKYEVNI